MPSTRRAACALPVLLAVSIFWPDRGISSGATEQTRDGSPAQSDWSLVVLGIAQDAGMPQIGCQRKPCIDVRQGRRRAEKVASIGLLDRRSGDAYLFDATPDFPAQVHALTGGRTPDGIFLTHAHIGHYTGLMYLGTEALSAKSAPVYASARMSAYLTANGPWSQLVQRNQIALKPLDLDRALALPHGLRVTAFAVPHRDEFSDTVGYLIETPRRRAAYIPDIDKWDKWGRSIRELAANVDLLLVDGTFASADELPNRPMSEIPHPLMSETRALVGGARARLLFIHLNHTNAQLDGGPDVAHEGMSLEM